MMAIEILEHAFRPAKQTVTDSHGLLKALNGWYLRWSEHAFLHPCVIDQHAALVSYN